MDHIISTRSKPLSFAVLGVGAVGGLYGGLLARAGYEVHFLARSDYTHLRDIGLRVESPLGNFQLSPNVYNEVSQMPQVDCVIVSWKTTANDQLPSVLSHFAATKPSILVLQNGLNIESSAAEIVGRESVFGGCCFLCANRIGPGHIKHLDYGRIAIGAFAEGQLSAMPQSNRDMQEIGSALRQTGIEIQIAQSLSEIRWKKLCWNIPYNGLSVVINADTSQIMQNPHASKLAEQLMLEVSQCAQACGVSIGREHIDKMLSDTRKMVPYASSMLLDYQNRRPMEVEAIFGNPLRAAQSAGFQPNKIEMLYQQLKFIDAQFL